MIFIISVIIVVATFVFIYSTISLVEYSKKMDVALEANQKEQVNSYEKRMDENKKLAEDSLTVVGIGIGVLAAYRVVKSASEVIRYPRTIKYASQLVNDYLKTKKSTLTN